MVASLSSHSPKEGCYAKRLKMGAEFKIDEDREEKETYEKLGFRRLAYALERWLGR